MTDTPRCSAHGHERCTWCSLNPANCGNPDTTSDCHSYSVDGMHWDTCRNRIRGPEDARNRLGLHALPPLGSLPPVNQQADKLARHLEDLARHIRNRAPQTFEINLHANAIDEGHVWDATLDTRPPQWSHANIMIRW